MADQPFCPCSMPSHRHNMLHYYWHCRVMQCRLYGLTCPRTPGSPCCSSTWRAQPGIARGLSGRFPTWLPGGLFDIVCITVFFAFPGSSIRGQVSIVTQPFDSKIKIKQRHVHLLLECSSGRSIIRESLISKYYMLHMPGC